MALSTLIAPGNTSATSADIVVGADAPVIVGVYAATDGVLPFRARFDVVEVTPGAVNVVQSLIENARSVQLFGPATYRVSRAAYSGLAFGVFKSDNT